MFVLFYFSPKFIGEIEYLTLLIALYTDLDAFGLTR